MFLLTCSQEVTNKQGVRCWLVQTPTLKEAITATSQPITISTLAPRHESLPRPHPPSPGARCQTLSISCCAQWAGHSSRRRRSRLAVALLSPGDAWSCRTLLGPVELPHATDPHVTLLLCLSSSCFLLTRGVFLVKPET